MVGEEAAAAQPSLKIILDAALFLTYNRQHESHPRPGPERSLHQYHHHEAGASARPGPAGPALPAGGMAARSRTPQHRRRVLPTVRDLAGRRPHTLRAGAPQRNATRACTPHRRPSQPARAQLAHARVFARTSAVPRPFTPTPRPHPVPRRPRAPPAKKSRFRRLALPCPFRYDIVTIPQLHRNDTKIRRPRLAALPPQCHKPAGLLAPHNI